MEDLLGFRQSTTHRIFKCFPTSRIEATPCSTCQWHPLLCVAGLSGMAVMAVGFYESHGMTGASPDRLGSYYSANLYHCLLTVALMGVPLTEQPSLTGCLMVSGTLLFCGPMYHYTMTEKTTYSNFLHPGGMLIFASWISMSIWIQQQWGSQIYQQLAQDHLPLVVQSYHFVFTFQQLFCLCFFSWK